MPSSKKPRKAYRPKYAPGTMPVVFRHDTDSEINLQLVPHDELEKFRRGVADEFSLNTLIFRLNWGYVMAGEIFATPEVRHTMERGLDAIRAVKARFERTGKYGATGEEFGLLGDALNAADEMQKTATRREQRDTMEIVKMLNAAIYKEPKE